MSSKNGSGSGRRDFIKQALFATVAMPAVGAAFRLGMPAMAAAPALAELKETDPLASALGYKANASKVDTKRFPKRAGAAGKKQFCDNCAQYSMVDGKTGKCAIFPTQGVVAAKGWCNSWTAKS